jgi:hypothetical protein
MQRRYLPTLTAYIVTLRYRLHTTLRRVVHRLPFCSARDGLCLSLPITYTFRCRTIRAKDVDQLGFTTFHALAGHTAPATKHTHILKSLLRDWRCLLHSHLVRGVAHAHAFALPKACSRINARLDAAYKRVRLFRRARVHAFRRLAAWAWRVSPPVGVAATPVNIRRSSCLR